MTRLAELSHGKTTQFLTKLGAAGLTAEDAESVLREPELIAEVVGLIRDWPAWTPWSAYGVPANAGSWHSLDTPHVLVQWAQVGERLRVRVDGKTQYRQLPDFGEVIEIAPGVEVKRPSRVAAIQYPTLLSVRRNIRLPR